MNIHTDFSSRHLGVLGSDRQSMLNMLGYSEMDGLIADAVPAVIRNATAMNLPAALSEVDALARLSGIMERNQLKKSFIGQGYYGTHTPTVIQRNILENPGWYTAYTPYQAEIAQGRLEALLNFQTMITNLTGLDVANASLLDEGTAAAEAMSLALAGKPNGKVIFVSERCHPQTIAVIQTRAEPLGIEVLVIKPCNLLRFPVCLLPLSNIPTRSVGWMIFRFSSINCAQSGL
jgi:glycine dehydrogenase